MTLYPTTSRSLSLRFGIDVRSTRAKGATQEARFCFLFPPFAQEVLSAPRSPWQRAYVERVIGSLRRECLDHVIVFHELSLRRILASYFQYYHRSRTHLSLEKDSPVPRSIQSPEMGRVVALPQLGGLHHRYERRAA